MNSLFWLVLALWIYGLSIMVQKMYSHLNTPAAYTKALQKDLQEKENAFFNFLEKNPIEIERASQGNVQQDWLNDLRESGFHLYIYKESDGRNRPVFWSNSSVVMASNLIDTSLRSGKLLETGNGFYEILKPVEFNAGRSYTVVGLIPIYHQYFIENQRLQNNFPRHPRIGETHRLSLQPTAYAVKGVDGKNIFYLQQIFQSENNPPIIFKLLLQGLALISLMVFISILSLYFLWDTHRVEGMMVFAFGFTVLFLLQIKLNFPINLNALIRIFEQGANAEKQQAIFLFIESAFLTWFTAFISSNIRTFQYAIKFNQAKFGRTVPGIMLAFLLAFIHLYVIRGLTLFYLNDSISFDLTNFMTLNVTSLFAFITLFMLAITHYLASGFVVKYMKSMWRSLWWFYFATIAAALFWLSIPGIFDLELPMLLSLIWLPVILFIQARVFTRQNTSFFAQPVGWLLLYAVSIAAMLSSLSGAKSEKRLYSYGKTLLVQYNKSSDYLVRIAAQGARQFNWSEALQNNPDSVTVQQLKEQAYSNHFGNWMAEYEKEVYLFDKDGNGIYNPAKESFASLNTLFETSRRDADYSFLAYFTESFENFGYVIRYNKMQGGEYVFIVIKPLRGSSKSHAPELFKQLQNYAIELPSGISYAWYNNGKLVEQHRQFPFPSVLPGNQPAFSEFHQHRGNNVELWMKAGDNRVLVIASKREPLLDFVSNVAYLFAGFLFLYLIGLPFIGIILHVFFSKTEVHLPNLDIKSKMRIIMIGFLIASFIIVAIFTINFLRNQFREASKERLSSLMETTVASILPVLPSDYSSAKYLSFQQAISQMAGDLNHDFNVYDVNGRLLATTQNVLFERQILSPFMNARAFWPLRREEIFRLLQDEKIGNLEFTSIYQPLRNSHGELFGYIQIPSFSSEYELRSQISRFVVILVNIIAFIFLISGIIAIIVSANITRSIQLVADRMNSLKLAGKNEPIEYKGKDEISVLVQRYNEMVQQLERSAEKLAVSEREAAWKEMARQVAHEIRNPLTPMKLSLQFLQRALDNDPDEMKEKTKKVTSTILHQIELLSRIALDFQQFANISQSNPDHISLRTLLKKTYELYSAHPNMEVELKLPENDDLIVFADSAQMSRLFTNLMQNAVEAIHDTENPRIAIHASRQENYVLVEIKDNGTGIEEDVRSSIFKPNFTTKNTGTGLGLAMCKAIVEAAEGQIGYHTRLGYGSDFWVQIPASG